MIALLWFAFRAIALGSLILCAWVLVGVLVVLRREIAELVWGWFRRKEPDYVLRRTPSRVEPIAYWDVSAQRALREISTHEDA